MKIKNNYRFLWGVLLSLAFLSRLGAAYYWESRVVSHASSETQTVAVDKVASSTELRNGPFFFGDSDSYWKLGRALAFGRPYQFDDERNWQIFRTPGYPALLAPLFWIWGENPPTFAARLLGAALGALNTALIGALVWFLLRARFPQTRKIALLSALFFALDPTLVVQSVLILSEEAFLTFALLQNICLLDVARKIGLLPQPTRDGRCLKIDASYAEWRLPRPLSIGRLIIMIAELGLTSAATVYIRPSWYYYLPFALIVLLIFRLTSGSVHEVDDYYYSPWEMKFSWSKYLLVLTLSHLILLAGLYPWIARNHRLTNRFVPTSLQLGASLYDGLNPNATGASDMSFVDKFRELEREAPSGSADEHFEIRLDRRLKKAAIEWTRNNPAKAVKLSFVKLYRLWSPTPRERAFAKPGIQIALALSFLPVFILGILGFAKSLALRGALWSLLIPALYVSALHSIFVSSIRYRVPTLYGFFILSAFYLFAIFNSLSSKNKN